jgi:hypothetical protein
MQDHGDWKVVAEAGGVYVLGSISLWQPKSNGPIRHPVVNHLRVKLYPGRALVHRYSAALKQKSFGHKKLVKYAPVSVEIKRSMD